MNKTSEIRVAFTTTTSIERGGMESDEVSGGMLLRTTFFAEANDTTF